MPNVDLHDRNRILCGAGHCLSMRSCSVKNNISSFSGLITKITDQGLSQTAEFENSSEDYSSLNFLFFINN
jgi:hypothetical protein